MAAARKKAFPDSSPESRQPRCVATALTEAEAMEMAGEFRRAMGEHAWDVWHQ